LTGKTNIWSGTSSWNGTDEEEVDELRRLLLVLRPGEDAGGLDLAEAARLDHAVGASSGCGSRRRTSRGARGVRDDDRAVALAQPPRERPVVGVLPPRADEHVVVPEPRPPVAPALLPYRSTVARRKARPGGGRRGVLHHGEAAVGGVDQVVEVVGRRQPGLVEVAAVVVQADLPVVDRRHPVPGVEQVGLVDVLQQRRLVGDEDVLLEGPREQRVVPRRTGRRPAGPPS
jgi:hypothetical protein